MPCRVLYVNASARLAGAENSLLQLVRALDRREFEPACALPQDGALSETLRGMGVPVLYAPLVRLKRTANPFSLAAAGGRTLVAAAILARWCRRRRISLIHSAGAAQAAAGPAAVLAGLPCVWHMRDIRPPRWASRQLARFADGIIAVSEAVRRAGGLAGRSADKVRVIPNGIDADAFAARVEPGLFRRELGLDLRTPLVLVASQIVPWKGHPYFLEAMAAVRRECPDAVAAVAGEDLFGDHPGYRAELLQLAAALGLEGAVHFLGYRTDMPTLMADADLLVVPSEAEPFGRVALEAMAVGTPVVGRAAGGLPEVVADGETGCLARGSSPGDMAALIAPLLVNADLRQALGTAGRRRVRERFDIREHAQRVCAVYNSLLGGAG